jgi:hypothetical protein
MSAEDRGMADLKGVPWSAQSYPWPDARLAPDPDAEREVATERLYWRSDGTLAYRAGLEYPVEERELLCTHEELSSR